MEWRLLIVALVFLALAYSVWRGGHGGQSRFRTLAHWYFSVLFHAVTSLLFVILSITCISTNRQLAADSLSQVRHDSDQFLWFDRFGQMNLKARAQHF